MSLGDCIGAALNRGAISKDEAEYLMQAAKDYDGWGAADAKKAFGERLNKEAAEQARVEGLAEQAQGAIYADLRRFARYTENADVVKAAYSLFENFGHAGFPSFRSIRNALLSEALQTMNDFMHTFRRDGAMRRMNRPLLDDVVRGLFGENVSDAAKALGQSWTKAAENLRAEFNRWGGHVAELKDWAVPQKHDAGALLNAGFDKWRDFIKDRLDWERIKSPLTETVVKPENRDLVLRRVYDSIVTDGWNSREPSLQMSGKGALHNQRDDARFLHFKNADAWLDYSREFGAGEPFAALLDHVNGLTRDVALMRRFGPNPASMVEYLKQVVASEGAKVKLEQPSMFPHDKKASADFTTRKTAYMLDGFYDAARGSGVPFSPTGEAIGMFRDVQYSAKLGAAVIVHAMTNPVIQEMGRALQGHSLLEFPMEFVRGFSRGEADRAGLILEDAMTWLEKGAREQSAWMKAREVTRWLPTVTARYSGLEAVAAASRRSAFMGQMASYARVAEKGFGELPARLRDGLAGFGIDADQWDKIRADGVYGEGNRALLRPQDVKDYEARLAYMSLLHGQTEAMVPSSNMRVQAATAFANKAPIAREVVKSALQFKSGFMATFMLTQIHQMQKELTRNGAAGLGGYIGSSVIALTLAGLATLQLKQMANGKDPLPMDATPEGMKTWGHAALTSGALGIYGDFLHSDMSSYGHGWAETLLGPTVTGVHDLGHSVVAGGQRAYAAATGEKAPPGTETGDVLKFARNNTPVLSTHWALKAGFNRLILDQLQYLADPNAHKAMRAQEMRIRRDTHQGYWWRPGEVTPDRLPEFTMGQ